MEIQKDYITIPAVCHYREMARKLSFPGHFYARLPGLAGVAATAAAAVVAAVATAVIAAATAAVVIIAAIAAAVAITAAAAAGARPAAAAANDDQQNDDPAAIASAKTVVTTHNRYLLRCSGRLKRSHSIVCSCTDVVHHSLQIFLRIRQDAARAPGFWPSKARRQ